MKTKIETPRISRGRPDRPDPEPSTIEAMRSLSIPILRFQSTLEPDASFTRVPTHEQIEQLAYNLYLRRGKKPGHNLDDWLTAENRLHTLLAEE